MAEAPEREQIAMIFKRQALELMGSDLVDILKANIFLQEDDLIGFTLFVTPAQKEKFCSIATGVFGDVEECKEAIKQMRAKQPDPPQESASTASGSGSLQHLKKKS